MGGRMDPSESRGNLQDDEILAPGTRFADYRIVRQLGTGAFGYVYLAEHPRLERQHVAKDCGMWIDRSRHHGVSLRGHGVSCSTGCG